MTSATSRLTPKGKGITTMCKRHGGDKRGSSRDRRARKQFMLSQWGNGETCGCVHCGVTLTFDTVEADRIIPGGSYRRDNVQPSCRGCNLDRSNNINWSFAGAETPVFAMA